MIAGGPAPVDDFTKDFVTDIMPYAETHYRVLADRAHRAIAGLSMGGNQTLNIAIPHLEKFAYVGVYSSGLIGAFGGGRGPAASNAPSTAAPPPPAWEQQHLAELDNAAARKRSEATLVQHRRGRWPDHDHKGHHGPAEETRVHASL